MNRTIVIGLCLLSVTAWPACQDAGRRRAAAPAVPSGTYADGPEGLKHLWTDILVACKRDDRGRVHDLMASLAMTQDELASVIGREKTTAMWPRYQALIGNLANIGSMELVAQVLEKKYDTASVVRVDTQKAEEQQPTDQTVLRALVQPVPVYNVRIRHQDGQKGLRYDFFIYLSGRWRTGNLLGKFMEPAAGPNKGG